MTAVAGPTRATSNNSSGNRVAGFFKVKSGEGIALALLSGAMIAVESGYWMGGNGLDALVFGQYGSGVLPWLLMGKGVLAFIALTLYGYWLNRINRGVLLATTSFTVITGLLIARFVIEAYPSGPVYFVIWPLAYVIPDLLVMQTWSLARQVFDTRQAKRLFPLITAGDTIGIVFGNFLTPVFVNLVGGSKNLLLVWAALTLVAYLLMRPLRRKIDSRTKKVTRKSRDDERNQSLWESLKLGFTIIRYYKMMGLLAITTATSALLYYALWLPYIDVSKKNYPNNADELASFFGMVSGGATLAAFVLSLFVVNRLFTRFGVRNFVMVTSTVNALGFILIFVTNLAFLPVVAFRLIQLVSMQAFTTSATQTLYNLIPPEPRDIGSSFNQAVSRQIGIILAGFMVLLPTTKIVDVKVIVVIAVGLSLFYFYTTLKMRSHYRPSLVQLLKEGQQDFFSSQEDEEAALFSRGNNNEALSIAINGLKDASEGTRRLSAEVLGKMGVEEAVAPLLKVVLTDQSAEVRRTCIVALSQLNSPDAFSTIAEALDDADPSVRAQAATALRTSNASLDPISIYFLRKALADKSPVVRREAVLTMNAFGYQKEALYVLWEMGRDSDPLVRAEAATGYGEIGDTGEQVLTMEVIYLLKDFDANVRRNAAVALSNLNGIKVLTSLIIALDDESPFVREAAAQSLARHRQESTPLMVNYLTGSTSERGQVEALHALTLARLEEIKSQKTYNYEAIKENQAAADASNGRLGKPAAEQVVSESVLNAANEQRLLEYGKRQLSIATRMVDYLRCLNMLDMSPNAWQSSGRRPKRDPANLVLVTSSLQSRYDNAVDRLIGVVGLLGNTEAIGLAGSSLRARGQDAGRKRADALETFENFGDPRLTASLIELLEAEEQGTKARPTRPRSLIETLRDIWLENDPWLQACVMHLVGLFNLSKLRPLVEQTLMQEADDNPLMHETALETQQRLDYPRDDEMLERLMLEKDMQTLGTLSTMSRILFLQKVNIFSSLSPEDLRRVALVSKERLFSPGEIICYEGDPGDELYIIVSGKVQIIAGYGGANTSGQGGGSGKTLRIASEGEAIGEMAILEDIPRSATLRAYNSPVRLLTLGEQEFKRIMRERPELAIELIRMLSRWLRETNRRVQDSPSRPEPTPVEAIG